jgi:hypothetical protein
MFSEDEGDDDFSHSDGEEDSVFKSNVSDGIGKEIRKPGGISFLRDEFEMGNIRKDVPENSGLLGTPC